ncbi:MAG TPA: NAD(P)H-dependent oxidoreductase [Streptosporangiaceae bacterium]
MRFVVVIGNPRRGSRTHAVAIEAARAVVKQAAIDTEPEILDLTTIGPQLLAGEPPAAVASAVDQVMAADLLLVASPTYKGTYTGLLKVFFDRFATDALRGTTALPLMVMGSPRHALAVEVHLRPLLVELGATVPTPGLALVETDLESPGEVLAEWAERVAPALR